MEARTYSGTTYKSLSHPKVWDVDGNFLIFNQISLSGRTQVLILPKTDIREIVG